MTTTTARDVRMANPAYAVPDAFPALMALGKSVTTTGLPATTAELVHTRSSQINGCGVCLVQHQRNLRKHGMSEDKIFAIAGWRDAPYFDGPERAALALAESLTRLADRADAVPDDVYDEAAHHFDEEQLGALILTIAVVNLWNRLNLSTHQVAGQEW